MNNNYLVRVQCMTYNHAPYIEDALNGFTMQQTKFPYICVIIDDASTDGEQEVIKYYLNEHFDLEDKNVARHEETDNYHLTFTNHKTNRNCYFAVLYLKYNHYSIKKSKSPYIQEWTDTKYVALCEGDDYWIDSEKLQKQYEVMESLPTIQMCTHAYKFVTSKKMELGDVHTLDRDGLLDTGLVIENIHSPQYATFFYRAKMVVDYPDFFKDLGVGDYPLRVKAAISGGIYYIDEVMSCYRKYSSGSWTSTMVNNVAKYLEHVERMRVFAEKLDVYTDGKYHKNVLNRIDYLVFLRCIKTKKIISATKTNYFKNKPLKNKVELLIQELSPKLWYMISKIYNRRL